MAESTWQGRSRPVAQVKWLPEAIRDVERLTTFLRKKNVSAAREAAVRLNEVAAILAKFPESGRRLDDASERREAFTAFGAGAYVLRYRIDAEGAVIILRAFHTRELR